MAAVLRKDHAKWFKSTGQAVKAIDKEAKEMEKTWNELLFTVCKGDATQMKQVSGFDISDFFYYIDNFQKSVKNG